MKNKLIYFALWLGIIKIEDEPETDEQKVDRLMRKFASDETWAEYSNLRWGVNSYNNQAAMDRLAAHVLHAVRNKETSPSKNR